MSATRRSKGEGLQNRRTRRRNTQSDMSLRGSSVQQESIVPGVFAVEFPQLCAENGATIILEIATKDPSTGQLVPIRPVSKERGTVTVQDSQYRKASGSPPRRSRASSLSPARVSITSQLIGPEKRSGIGAAVAAVVAAIAGADGGDQESLFPPLNYVIVSYEDDKAFTNLKTITFKGYPLEEAIIKALGSILPRNPTVTAITIKKCDLNQDLLSLLADSLNKGKNLCELHIDECPIPEQNYDSIFRECEKLEILSLRGCMIDDKGARLLAEQLTWKPQVTEISLRYLNLSTNMIEDEGACALADALRTNRKLIGLVLCGNYIGDDGAIALADAAGKFQVNDKELLQIKEITELRLKRFIQLMSKPSTIRFSSVPAWSKKGKSSKSVASTKSPTTSVVAGQQDVHEISMSIDEEMGLQSHPFRQDIQREGGKIYCTGNFVITHINLAYNKVQILGVQRFLQVLCYQTNTKSNLISNSQQLPGLTNVVLEGNPIPDICLEFMQLKDLLSRIGKTKNSTQSLQGSMKRSELKHESQVNM